MLNRIHFAKMKEKLLKPKIIISVVVALLIILLAFFFIQYKKTQSELSKIKSTNQISTENVSDAKKLIEEVSRVMVLPQNETPKIVTVSDVEKLKATQPFFQYAKNGDKVLVYTNRAILYDPVAKKIVDVSRLSQSTASAQIAPSPTLNDAPRESPTPVPTPQSITASYKFTIYNGTKTVGLTKTFETETLMKKLPSSIVIKKADAKGDYTKSLIIDISGTKAKEVEQIAVDLGLENAILPEKETAPSGADFLIIIGTDYQ